MNNIIKNIKNILVAIDFSENSDFAISRAIEIAKLTNANLIIQHVVPKGFFDNIIETVIPKKNLKTTKEYIKNRILEKIHALSHHEINIDYEINLNGKPAVKILQFARKNKVDLLVIGAHGKYSIRDSFVGTTAEYIAKKAQCPILIIKTPTKKAFKKILVPIDFSDVNKKALNYALQLFPDANTHLIHVGDYEYEELLKHEEKKEHISKNKINTMRDAILVYLENRMKKFIKEYGNKLNNHSYTCTLGYPGPSIIKEATKLKSDLIIMGTHGYIGAHYLFIGNVTNWVLTEANKDILLVPSKNYL